MARYKGDRMTAISDFVANPSQFLRNNLLRANFQLNPLDGQDVRMFKFVPHPYQGTKLSDGSTIPSYALTPVGQSERITLRADPNALNRDYLNAYWCNYAVDLQFAIIVANAADFMFTSNMDGCTFGVGSPAANGACRVSHINLRSQPNSHNLQRGTLSMQGFDDKVVDPDRYMTSSRVPTALYGEIKATTIGIRNTGTGQWEFRYQQFRLLNGAQNQAVLIALKQV